jgi:presenilin-like A22 family membrane protease
MFIHIVPWIKTSFFFMAKWFSVQWIYHIVFYSLVGGHLSYFHLLAISINASMNIHLQMFIWTCFWFFESVPRSRTVQNFEELANCFPNWLHISHSHQQPTVWVLQSLLYVFLIVAVVVDRKWHLIVVLIWISLVAANPEHIFKCFFTEISMLCKSSAYF